MSTGTSIVELPLGHPGLKDFVKFPWKLYRGDPGWTPPLNADYLGSRLLGLKGLLTRNHPYHRHAEVTHFLAKRDGQTIGRISAAVNHEFNRYHKTNLGSFGFFEVVNDYDTARLLIDHARDWASRHGVDTMRGPGEYSNATHERQGILVEGFEYQPTVECTHNPPYYGQFLERYGMRKAKDYLALNGNIATDNLGLLRRLARHVDRRNVEIRCIDIKNLRAEVQLIVEMYNEAWAANWGFMPMTREEGDAIADTLRLIIDPGLVRFAYVGGKPAAVMGLIPDPNQALRPRWKWYGDSDFVRVTRLLIMRRRIRQTRGMFFGIRPQFRMSGLPALIMNEIADYMITRGYTDAEGSLILEDNDGIIRLVTTFGTRFTKRWRIYDLPLK